MMPSFPFFFYGKKFLTSEVARGARDHFFNFYVDRKLFKV